MVRLTITTLFLLLFIPSFTVAQKLPIEKLVIKVAIDREYEPYEYLNDKNIATGFTPSLLEEIGKEAGVSFEFIPLNLPEAIEALENGKVDIVNMISSPDRMSIYEFSNPHSQITQALFCNERVKDILAISSLSKHLIGFQRGDISLKYFANRTDFSKEIVNSKLDGLLHLNVGVIDAFFCSQQAGISIVSKYNLTNVNFVAGDLFSLPYAFAAHKGNRQIIELLNINLAKLESSGRLKELKDNWLSYKMTNHSWIEKNQQLFYILILFLVIIFVLLIVWNRSLQRRVLAKTKSLQTEEERFRSLIEGAPDAIFLADPKTGEILDVNKAGCGLMAKKREEIIGSNHSEIYSQQFKELSSEMFDARVNKANGSTLSEQVILRSDGTLVPVEIHSEIIRIHDQNVLMGTFRDITQRKLVEEENRNSRLLLEASLNSQKDMMLFSIDRNYRYIYFNTAHSVLMKHSHNAEIKIGESILEYIKNPKSRASAKEAYDRALTGESISAEYEFGYEDFKYFEKCIDPVLNADLDIIGVVGINRNITQRKRAEIKLRKLSRSVDQSPVSIFITDIFGTIEYVNPKFTEVTGYSSAEVIGQNPRILQGGENPREFYVNLWDTLLSGDVWNGEIHNKKKNGELYWESALISPIKDDKGIITHFVAIKEDITEKKKMIDDLVTAKNLAEQSNKLKDAFIANMSHEIRTPLNGVLGMTSIIKEVYSPYISGDEEEYFTAVDKSCHRIIRTVDMILNYSRLYVGAFTVSLKNIDFSSVCECLIDEFRPLAIKRSLLLTYENLVGNVILFVDKDSITESISGLIDNALKFTDKGFVKVVLQKGENNDILLEIIDSGIGISKEFLSHIFEPYSQEQIGYGRAYEGVGLGLALVKKIVNLNHGTISVVSKKGEGSTFLINFGQAVQTVGDSKNASYDVSVQSFDYKEERHHVSAQPAIELKKKVLIVEDDEVNQEIITLYLAKKYDLTITETSNEVLKILKMNKIDVILMDISINGHQNGLELTKEIKAIEEYSKIPIIAVTAHIFANDRENAKVAGCDDYLPKPFTKNSLLEKIEMVLT